jgi:hypothetical protein
VFGYAYGAAPTTASDGGGGHRGHGGGGGGGGGGGNGGAGGGAGGAGLVGKNTVVLTTANQTENVASTGNTASTGGTVNTGGTANSRGVLTIAGENQVTSFAPFTGDAQQQPDLSQPSEPGQLGSTDTQPVQGLGFTDPSQSGPVDFQPNQIDESSTPGDSAFAFAPPIPATPEVDSLSMIAVGVTAMAGYALTRYRGRQRQDDTRG